MANNLMLGFPAKDGKSHNSISQAITYMLSRLADWIRTAGDGVTESSPPKYACKLDLTLHSRINEPEV